MRIDTLSSYEHCHCQLSINTVSSYEHARSTAYTLEGTNQQEEEESRNQRNFSCEDAQRPDLPR